MNKLNKSIDLTKIYDIKIVQILFNILFSLSTACITAILIIGEWSNSVIDIVLPTLSFFIMLFISIKFNLLKTIFYHTNRITLLISTILGIYTIYLIFLNMPDYSTTFANIIFVVFSIPAAIIVLYLFYSKFWHYFKLFIRSLDKLEKTFLIVAISIFTIAIIIIYNVTNVFTKAYISEPNRIYNLTYSIKNDESIQIGQKFVNQIFDRIRGDVIFTSDTQVILGDDLYNTINGGENDLRQPLFAIFSIPFTIVPRIISDFTIKEIYPFMLAIVQSSLVFISIVLLQRLMKLKGWTRLLFMIFLSVSYPTLLFLVNMEQYVISVFYLVTFIYMSINDIKDKDIAYICATGTLLTSGIFFPLLFEKRDFKKSIKIVLFTFLKFMAIFIISAKILLVLPTTLNNQINTFSIFTDESKPFNERINMYSNFALNTVAAPEITISEDDFLNQILVSGIYVLRLSAYNPQLSQTNNTDINICGVIILLLTLIAFISNYKDKLSKICIFWIVFSIILLPILRYGAYENGFILYTYYFSWAFVCLLFKFFESIFKKLPKIKNILYTFAIIIIGTVNFYGIYQIIEFGIQYYK